MSAGEIAAEVRLLENAFAAARADVTRRAGWTDELRASTAHGVIWQHPEVSRHAKAEFLIGLGLPLPDGLPS